MMVANHTFENGDKVSIAWIVGLKRNLCKTGATQAMIGAEQFFCQTIYG